MYEVLESFVRDAMIAHLTESRSYMLSVSMVLREKKSCIIQPGEVMEDFSCSLGDGNSSIDIV